MTREVRVLGTTMQVAVCPVCLQEVLIAPTSDIDQEGTCNSLLCQRLRSIEARLPPEDSK